MSDQPEALRLADVLDAHQFDEPHAAASCLRRQHAEIERLYAQRFSAVEDYEKAPDWSLLEATQGALREHMAEIHKLRAENAALRADAERYRWLRSLGASWETEAFIAGLTPEQYDDAIDAAREKK